MRAQDVNANSSASLAADELPTPALVIDLDGMEAEHRAHGGVREAT